MNEREKRIERLAARWFAAETTEAEERKLREWFRRTRRVPESLHGVRELFLGLDALSEERMPDSRHALRRYTLRRRLVPLWGLAAAAALALGIFLCAELLRKPYCYIDGVAVYDREAAMQTTVYLEPLAALDAPEGMVDELIRNN